ncbi:MAG: hypothetical protein MJZ78_03885 [Bacteroidales bacterium]|nr:hypothetical protein [Bacteroidales bacterium]
MANAIEIVVAHAAPAMPILNLKMKSASRTMFSIAPLPRMSIDLVG